MLNVKIYTNSIDDVARHCIERILASAGVKGSIILVHDLEDPFYLTWAHKQDIKNWVADKYSIYTHYIYIEDDERLTWENFLYLLHSRNELKLYGLLPGLVRTEWRSLKSEFVSLDIIQQIDLNSRNYVEGNDWVYVDPSFPYCGSFILDRETALEYVESSSFDQEKSKFIPWNIRERAAAGLTWERIPESFSSRIVVPINRHDNSLPAVCWLAHLPNNYADDPNTPHSKIPLDSLLLGKIDPLNLISPKYQK